MRTSQLFLIAVFGLHSLSQAQGQELLQLTFKQGPVLAGQSYGSKPGSPTMSVLNGQQLILKRSSGTDYQIQASGWSWGQVQQTPRNETSLVVSPTLDNEKVSIQVNYHRRDGDDSITYQGNVIGDIGKWIPLLSSSHDTATGTSRTYSAGSTLSRLSVKVERAK